MMYVEKFDLKHETAMEALMSGNEVVIREVLGQFQDLDVHKVCQNGTTLACAGVKTGDVGILKMLLEETNPKSQKSVEGLEKTNLSNELPDPIFFGCFGRANLENFNNIPVYTYDSPGKIFHLDKYGKNVLHYAVLSNNVQMVHYLLKNFKDLRTDQIDLSLNSPLHLAVSIDSNEMVKLLISFGASIDLKDSEGKTSLHIASERGSIDVMTTLLEANANVNALDNRGQSTLMLATMYRHCSAAELLIRRGVKVNYEDDLGFTALKRAVFIKNSKVTKILVTNGARICESFDLLHYATIYNQFDILNILLDGGARLDSQNKQGFTPLMVAVEHQNLEMTKLLLERGADPNKKNWVSGTTALHLSMFGMKELKDLEPFLSLLVKHGADLYMRCRYGFDALYYALEYYSENAACHLIKIGMDVNFRHKDAPRDYLSYAMRYSHNTKPVKMLLMAGFDLKNFEDTKLLQNPNWIGADGEEKVMAVHNFLRTTMKLKEYCRIKIRRMCKYQDIETLAVPIGLRKYLRLEYVDISML